MSEHLEIKPPLLYSDIGSVVISRSSPFRSHTKYVNSNGHFTVNSIFAPGYLHVYLPLFFRDHCVKTNEEYYQQENVGLHQITQNYGIAHYPCDNRTFCLVNPALHLHNVLKVKSKVRLYYSAL